jgi:hypothetical protein
MRRHPHLFEVNARILLGRLSRIHGRGLTLGTVPGAHWDLLARRGFDGLWLMGVWRRSPAARQAALTHPALRAAYAEALPDLGTEDVEGSPYAILDYEVDPALGTDNELCRLRAELNRRGMRLILDFVPNHLARDHAWTIAYPQRFVPAPAYEGAADPDWFFETRPGGPRLAHGRDPSFPPWTDTAQVNFASEDARAAPTRELLRVASLADGVRCDMAMLALNEVFLRVWPWAPGGLASSGREFWTDAIAAVRQTHQNLVMLAEAYWGLEGRLLELGFDFAYDKTLYDALRWSGAAAVRAHLAAGSLDGRAARFIENHDEARALAAFGAADRARAAAVVVATLPGLRLFHDGQLDGRRTRLPVQLVREPEEDPDPGMERFYDTLLGVCNDPVFHVGTCHPCAIRPAGEGDGSHEHVLAWSWHADDALRVVVVNYSGARAQARIEITGDRAGSPRLARDLLSGRSVPWEGEADVRTIRATLDPWEPWILAGT